MGYNVDGSITIEPPLNFAEIKTARQVALGMLPPKSLGSRHAVPETVFGEYMPLSLQIDEFDQETDEGILKVRQAGFLRPSFSSNAKLSYDMDKLIVALIKALPGHTWIGTIVAVHEEMTEAEKVVVKAPGEVGSVELAVRKVKGEVLLRWEDGSGEEKVSDLIG